MKTKTHIKRFLGFSLLSLTAAFHAEANLISNGNFEAGNIGFFSDYAYRTDSIYDPATYAITTNPHLVHTSATAYGDHTSGRGNMMAINGAIVQGKKVWSDAITLTKNTDYIFSLWVSSWHVSNPALLDFSLNAGSTYLGTVSAPVTTGRWDHHTLTFNSGMLYGPMDLSITDLTTKWDGNDFAIDDLSLVSARVPEPTSALLLGLGLMGIALYKKKPRT